MSDDEDNNDPKKKGAIDYVRNVLFKKPSVVNATSGDEEEKDGKTQKAETEEKEENQEALPKIVAIKEEIEEEKESQGEESQGEGGRGLPEGWERPDGSGRGGDGGAHHEVEPDRSRESKVIRLIPERLRGNDGIIDTLEELLDLAQAGRLPYLTLAYGIDKGFGRVESKAAWRVRDPGDHESARDIIFALEQLKYLCLKEWTDIERIEK